MSLLGLSLAYIRARALNAGLNLALLALGVATIVLLLLLGAQLEDRLTRDARGIDLVIGSKAGGQWQHVAARQTETVDQHDLAASATAQAGWSYRTAI